MIHLDLTIDSDSINAEVMEKIRMRLRREVLPFIMQQVEDIADEGPYRFGHRDVQVDGTILMKDSK